MEYYGYLYAYFRWLKPGKNLQQIYFALSRDDLHYSALHNNEIVLESCMGTKAVRAPHIIRSKADGQFYILATDLDTRENRWNDYIMNGSKYIAVCQPPDLIHWENALREWIRKAADRPWLTYLKLADNQFIELFHDLGRNPRTNYACRAGNYIII